VIFPDKETVACVRAQYPAGLRVELVRMNDPYTKLRPGEKGVVDLVDDTGTVHIAWDRGCTLGAVYGEDEIRVLPPEQGLRCRRCGGPVYASELPQYNYQCLTCDEDLFEFEVEEGSPCAT